MKRLVFYSLFFLASLASAQVNINWGEFQKTPDEGGFIRGERNGALFTVLVEDGIPYLVNYNPDDLAPEFYRELELGPKVEAGDKSKDYTWETLKKRKDKSKNKNYNYEKTLILKDRIVTIYYVKDKRLKTFYGQAFDFSGSALTGRVQIESFEERSYSNTHYYDISEDSSMVYMFRQPKLDKDEKDKFFLKIWGSSLEELHNLEIELPYANKEFSVNDYYLTSDKQLLMLARIDIPKKERQKGDPSNYFKLINLNVAAGEMIDFELKLRNRFIRNINLRFDDKENAYCVGVYGDDKGGYDYAGTFFYKLDYKTGEITSENLEDFSPELIKEMNNSDSDRKNNQELRANINLKQVISKPDGGNFVIFEEEYIQVSTYTNSNGSTSTTYYYHNNDILVMNLDNAGEIVWQAVIPKQQMSVNDNGMFNSFFATFYNNKLHFIFNDHIDNAESTGFGTRTDVGNAAKMNPVLVSMTSEGEYEKYSMLTFDKSRDFRMTFRNAAKIAENKLAFYSYKAKKGCCSAGGRTGTSTSTYRIGKIEIQ
jgi:hypothetical protein